MSEQSNKIGFSLRKVTTEQFAIIESSYEEDKAIDLQAGLKFGLNNHSKVISTIFSTNLLQVKTPFLILEVGCHFSITKDAWNSFLNEENSKIVIPKDFISHLVMLTIGTARGVLHSKTENSPFNDFLLPTLNVNDLVKEDVAFEIDLES